MFISTNAAFSILQNKYFLSLINENSDIPSYQTFRDSILNGQVMDVLHESIETVLSRAVTISLVVDLWSNTSVLGYMGLGALTQDEFSEKELCILGFIDMNDGTSAEMIGAKVEILVNRFEFDKRKIKGF